MENPTIVVITDRNDLDDQLFGTFSRCAEILRQTPEQAESREDLTDKLHRRGCGRRHLHHHPEIPAAGRVGGRSPTGTTSSSSPMKPTAASTISSTATPAHMRDALPNASFIGFTGTPIELTDTNTRAVFGDYISIYDIQQAVEDGATVRIYYEGRLAKLELDEKRTPEDRPGVRGSHRRRGSRAEGEAQDQMGGAGSHRRHGETRRPDRQRFRDPFRAAPGSHGRQGHDRVHDPPHLRGLYNAIITLRPEWHSDDDKQGAIKIVMTGTASRPAGLAAAHPHQGAPRRTGQALQRTRTIPFKIVIVRDMWLTGFDVPPLHTMYIDKPMQGHGLMQAIARVNRVYKDKPGGLIVDYLGLAYHLQKALAAYTESGGTGGDRHRPGTWRWPSC